MTDNKVDDALFPNGPPAEGDLDRIVELYKMMVASSEALVARRQGVNTFFLTINGALLTAGGIIVGHSGDDQRLRATGLIVLTVTGVLLAFAWHSLILSFGQLNTGKFAVINRLEALLPASVYLAEWIALGEGKDPKKYRTFTSREVWVPRAFILLYAVATIFEALVASKALTIAS